ncbi:TetR family transcriptional regulator [Kribbella sandramycini]|uniref:AcrR family transcriptional regulator n=1 Tax=Kribbella sandramycini TaxID=60450 RepID=A0A841SN08_9ACTN|nr:AcrR family transcriptional regulator [Kribbella sandramycini]
MTGRTVTRRMPREQRREQLVDAATTAFARTGGYPRTSLEEIAAEAGVTAAIIYRHFTSKAELYQAAIDRACLRLFHTATDADGELTDLSLARMLTWASAEPAAFRLLFRYARLEPEFSHDIEQLWSSMVGAARPHVAAIASSPAWADWGAHLNTTVVIESILVWLDSGSPDPAEAAARLALTVTGIEQAVRAPS